MNEVQRLLNFLSKRKLSITILAALYDGPIRYTVLLHLVSQLRSEPVHARTLTATLQYLRAERLVEHYQHNDSADYRLTAGGRKFMELLTEIEHFASQRRQQTAP